jgi:hypothetical protein
MYQDKAMTRTIRFPNPEGEALLEFAERKHNGNVNGTVREAIRFYIANSNKADETAGVST